LQLEGLDIIKGERLSRGHLGIRLFLNPRGDHLVGARVRLHALILERVRDSQLLLMLLLLLGICIEVLGGWLDDLHLVELLLLLRLRQAHSIDVHDICREFLEQLPSLSTEAPLILGVEEAPDAACLDLIAEHLDLLIQFLEAHEELIDVREALLLGAHHTDNLDLAFDVVAAMPG
jgi:hypothetical protein